MGRLIASALALIISWPGLAAEPGWPIDADRGTFTVTLDNDLFANTDRHYTNGIRASYLKPPGRVPGWIDGIADAFPAFSEGGVRRVGLALGQSMFTPENIARPIPDPKDRPYVGWLYGGIAISSQSDRRLDVLELDFGLVGPYSLADKTQRLVHYVTDSTQPRGWDKQLHTEPGVLLSYQWAWREPLLGSRSSANLDLTPHFRADVGNIYTQGAVGGTLRLGFNLPEDFGPPRAGQSFVVTDSFERQAKNSASWYVFGAAEVRGVLQNLFLDGNSFSDGPSVDKHSYVGSVQFGVALNVDLWRVAYTHVMSTKEFYGQKSADSYGVVAFSIATKF